MWEGLTERMEGSLVVLEPLRAEHRDGLRAASMSPEIWEWLPRVGSSDEYFDRWFDWSLEVEEQGLEGVLATIDLTSGQPVGSSRYLNLRPEHRSVEIGFTWLAPRMWRTGANVEAKLLMLRHAFEKLSCLRVEFKTDARNVRSRGALEALPAKREGVLRNHMVMPDVGLRDSAYYSVIESEWPEVKARLEERLRRRSSGARPADPGSLERDSL